MTELEKEFNEVLKSQFSPVINALQSNIQWLKDNTEKYGAALVNPVIKEYTEALDEWKKDFDALVKG
jgi:hypothetical protein